MPPQGSASAIPLLVSAIRLMVPLGPTDSRVALSGSSGSPLAEGAGLFASEINTAARFAHLLRLLLARTPSAARPADVRATSAFADRASVQATPCDRQQRRDREGNRGPSSDHAQERHEDSFPIDCTFEPGFFLPVDTLTPTRHGVTVAPLSCMPHVIEGYAYSKSSPMRSAPVPGALQRGSR